MDKLSCSVEHSCRLPQLYIALEKNDQVIRDQLKVKKNGHLKSAGPKVTVPKGPWRYSPQSHPYYSIKLNREFVKQEEESMAAISRLNHGFCLSNMQLEPGLHKTIKISSSANSGVCADYKPYERVASSPASSNYCDIKEEPLSPGYDASQTVFSESLSSSQDSDYGHSSELSPNSGSAMIDESSTKEHPRFSHLSVLTTMSKGNSDSKPPERTIPSLINIKKEPSDSEQNSSDNGQSEHFDPKPEAPSSSGSSRSEPKLSERAAFVRSEVLGNPVLQTLFKDLFVLKTQYNNIDEQTIANEVKAMKKRNKLPI